MLETKEQHKAQITSYAFYKLDPAYVLVRAYRKCAVEAKYKDKLAKIKRVYVDPKYYLSILNLDITNDSALEEREKDILKAIKSNLVEDEKLKQKDSVTQPEIINIAFEFED